MKAHQEGVPQNQKTKQARRKRREIVVLGNRLTEDEAKEARRLRNRRKRGLQ